MKKIRNNLTQRAFTLIEVLLSVLIVAMMAGGLYATFAAGIKLDERIKYSLADLDEGRIVTEQLRRDLGRAVSYDFRGSFPDQKAFFDNNENLVFVIDDGQKLRWVRYRVIDKKPGELMREEGDFVQLFDSPPSLKPDTSEVLTKRLANNGWDVSCASAIVLNQAPAWRKEWVEDYIPGVVEMTLLLQNDKGQIKKIVSDFVLPAGGRYEM